MSKEGDKKAKEFFESYGRYVKEEMEDGQNESSDYPVSACFSFDGTMTEDMKSRLQIRWDKINKDVVIGERK